MTGFRLTPARRRGVEILDDPRTPDDVRAESMEDVERSNVLFGGRRAVSRVAGPLLRDGDVLLDVGTGRGDIPIHLAGEAAHRGARITTIGLDISLTLARVASGRVDSVVMGDARRLPFRDASVDVVTSSQVAHHFFDDDLRQLIAELHRVSRRHVVLADLRRSLVAALAFWIASFLWRFHWATRLDGVTSVLRGFTPNELAAIVRDVTGVTPTVRRGVFWRVTAEWPAR